MNRREFVAACGATPFLRLPEGETDQGHKPKKGCEVIPVKPIQGYDISVVMLGDDYVRDLFSGDRTNHLDTGFQVVYPGCLDGSFTSFRIPAEPGNKGLTRAFTSYTERILKCAECGAFSKSLKCSGCKNQGVWECVSFHTLKHLTPEKYRFYWISAWLLQEKFGTIIVLDKRWKLRFEQCKEMFEA
jgi:hypothetical protein